MDWKISDIPDQSGKVIMITGANSGLGFQTAKILCHKGAHVLMACRSNEKAESACQIILSEKPLGSMEIIQLDLSDLTNISSVIIDLFDRLDQLDVLINNAGIMAPPKTLSAQGLEIQFAVNHLAHMALAVRLIPLLAKSKDSRVVTVTSAAQYIARVFWDDLQGEKTYDPWSAYSQSKLLNVMFALELGDRLRKKNVNVKSILAHPGLAKTELQSKSILAKSSWKEEIAYKLLDPIFQSAKMGALPQLLAATAPFAKGGEQYCPKYNFRGYPRISRHAKLALDKIERSKLWSISEELISKYIY